MGKITMNGKDITKPFVAFTSGPHAGKKVMKITMGGKTLTLQKPNSFTGTFSTPAKKAEFMAITTSVAAQQFHHEFGLTSVSLPQVTNIGLRGFDSSPLTSLDLPKATTIGDYAFGDSKLTTLNLPLATTIGEGAFYSSPLTSLDLPKATTIGQYSFSETIDAATTHITMKSKFNNDTDKDKIFYGIVMDYYGWDKITFRWV